MNDLDYAIAVLRKEADSCFDITKRTALEIALQVLKGREVTFTAATPEKEWLDFMDFSRKAWAKDLEEPLSFALTEDGKLVALGCNGCYAQYPGKFVASWATDGVMADLPVDYTCTNCAWTDWRNCCQNPELKGIHWPACDSWTAMLDDDGKPIDSPRHPQFFQLTPAEEWRIAAAGIHNLEVESRKRAKKGDAK